MSDERDRIEDAGPDTPAAESAESAESTESPPGQGPPGPPGAPGVSPRRRRWMPSLTTIVTLVLLGFVGTRAWPQLAAAVGASKTGAPAPAFTLTTLGGDYVSLEKLRGQVVVLNFWATWCGPCRREMPAFQEVYTAKRDRGLAVVGVSVDVGGERPVRRFLEEYAITYPIAMANRQMQRDYGGIRLLPTTFLIDRQGRIRHEVHGYFTQVALEQAVDRLLAEP